MEKPLEIIGIDLGGTWIKLGIVSLTGEIRMKKIIHTNLTEGFLSIVNRIVDAIFDFKIPKGQECIIGIGSPGSVDREEKKIIFSPNFPDWVNVPLGSTISNLTGYQVFLENDAKAAACGEKWFGAGINLTNFFVLTLGTGVGGGAMIDGKILKGGQGFGGELGHICVFPRGYPCGCGSVGCLEVYASKSGLTTTAKSMQRNFPLSPIFEHENPGKISIKEIFLQYKKGDPLSCILINQMVDALGTAIGSLVNVLNPNRVILSGGISKSLLPFLPTILDIANQHTMKSMRTSFDVVISPIFEDAGILGAGSIAFEEYHANLKELR